MFNTAFQFWSRDDHYYSFYTMLLFQQYDQQFYTPCSKQVRRVAKEIRLQPLNISDYIWVQVFHSTTSKMTRQHAEGLKQCRADVWSTTVCPKGQTKAKKQLAEKKE